MEEEGLIEVKNLSGNLLENGKPVEGAVSTAIYEGSRAVLFEIQALVATAGAGFPRRTSIGVDNQRLGMLLAVLEKRAWLNLANQDVYTNVVGGLRPDSTSVDLAVCLAVYSSAKGYTPKEKILAVGEVGLTGEIRNVPGCDKIVSEAARLGFSTIFVPKKCADKINSSKLEGVKLIGVTNIYQAIKIYIEG